MTAATLQLISAALCWNDNIIAQMFSTDVPRELDVLQRDIPKWIL